MHNIYCNPSKIIAYLLHIVEMSYFVLLVAQYIINFLKLSSTSASNLFVLCKDHGCNNAISLLNIGRLLLHYCMFCDFLAQMIFANLIFDEMNYFLPIWLGPIFSDFAQLIFAHLIFFRIDYLPKWFLPKWFCPNDFCPFDFCPFEVLPLKARPAPKSSK